MLILPTTAFFASSCYRYQAWSLRTIKCDEDSKYALQGAGLLYSVSFLLFAKKKELFGVDGLEHLTSPLRKYIYRIQTVVLEVGEFIDEAVKHI